MRRASTLAGCPLVPHLLAGAHPVLTPSFPPPSPTPHPRLQDGSFEHPYSYLLFLGADGQGNMIPARQ